MELSLRDLQLLAEAEYSVEATRRDLARIVEFFKQADYYDEYIRLAFEEMRQLPRWVAEDSDVFFVHEDTLVEEIPEDLRHDSLGLVSGNRVLYAGRLVYPVKDVRNQVMGFCGWEFSLKVKYLDSQNSGYKAKVTTFYGMEKLPEYYCNREPVYIVEGIVCCLYLRSIGLQAFAMLGSNMSRYVIEILKRFGRRLIVIPDNDVVGKLQEGSADMSSIDKLNGFRPAGEHFVQLAKKNLPMATVIQSKIAKDVDDTRKFENHKYEEQFITDLKAVAVMPYGNFETIRVR